MRNFEGGNRGLDKDTDGSNARRNRGHEGGPNPSSGRAILVPPLREKTGLDRTLGRVRKQRTENRFACLYGLSPDEGDMPLGQ